jgi:pimeloyl-ACP methyl ester carboxylesterase
MERDSRPAITPEDCFVATNGLRLHYRDWGGAGQPIVLLHGLASNARIWDFVAPLLARAARVIALDQRGHGASDRPEHGYTFDEVTADLAGVTDALGFDAPLIVGHSWGANVAVTYAASHAAGGIALVDGGTFDLSATPGMTWEEAERTMAPPRLAGTPRARFMEMMRERAMPDLWSAEVEDIIMAQFDVFPDDTIAPRLTFERHMAIVRAIWDYHPAELLASVTCPVLVLPTMREGASDWVERKRAAIAAAELVAPHMRTFWLEDSIHDVPLQRPALLADTLIEFVNEIGTHT